MGESSSLPSPGGILFLSLNNLAGLIEIIDLVNDGGVVIAVAVGVAICVTHPNGVRGNKTVARALALATKKIDGFPSPTSRSGHRILQLKRRTGRFFRTYCDIGDGFFYYVLNFCKFFLQKTIHFRISVPYKNFK